MYREKNKTSANAMMQGNVASSSHPNLRFLGQKSDRGGGIAITVVLQGMLKLSARSGDGGGRIGLSGNLEGGRKQPS